MNKIKVSVNADYKPFINAVELCQFVYSCCKATAYKRLYNKTTLNKYVFSLGHVRRGIANKYIFISDLIKCEGDISFYVDTYRNRFDYLIKELRLGKKIIAINEDNEALMPIKKHYKPTVTEAITPSQELIKKLTIDNMQLCEKVKELEEHNKVITEKLLKYI